MAATIWDKSDMREKVKKPTEESKKQQMLENFCDYYEIPYLEFHGPMYPRT